MQEYSIYISYTSDNESEAKHYIHAVLLESSFFEVLDISLENSQRACRNAYGKEVNEEEFNSLGIDDEAVWFDDYDMVFCAKIKTSLSEEELLSEIETLGLSCESETEYQSKGLTM